VRGVAAARTVSTDDIPSPGLHFDEQIFQDFVLAVGDRIALAGDEIGSVNALTISFKRFLDVANSHVDDRNVHRRERLHLDQRVQHVVCGRGSCALVRVIVESLGLESIQSKPKHEPEPNHDPIRMHSKLNQPEPPRSDPGSD
jgi:hypothetical protein